ncbi:mitochondrial distribution and morphology protein 34 [Kwoniella pini CBS 10737]|uniref:Mitochondrial distribution and morphology protein 34 n=1 Tax=Kwoniella pini CBS 10737 TaxID=1296096 RepID=A0A1B9HY40_9TREE|nr:mitochondrial distribution and morphology protein 34 [Kwoniella pini CBS 10737]OCF48192.1 mitochondrial distribution and morphology protein 34 [Kwoniella pini CBS 10737]
MSFVFPSWSTAFSPAFHEDAKAMLEGALNKGNKPPVIQGRIEVVELSMGKEPPTLTLLEIGDLSLDRFRGILRLGYSGDAWLEVRCRVQANPLSHNPNLSSSSTLPLSTPLLASQPLLVPMTLRLSKLHLRAILILVVSASKGITLVFKNDPLQNVDVSSTFDSIEVIRGYLQQEIEGQLREMFREDLPGIIHRLSQRWFHGTGVGGKVETPYRDIGVNETIPEDEREREEDEIDDQNPYAEPLIFPPHPSNPEKFNTPRKQALARSMRNRRPSTSGNSISESPTSYTTFPDIEDYDPTYGLRPEGVPTHSGYEAFGRLWEKSREGGNRGLGSLMSMPLQQDDDGEEYQSDEFYDEEEDEDEIRSFDMVEMDDALRSIPRKSRRQSLISAAGSRVGSGYGNDQSEQVEWETFPAVGGGLITRPRVYHSQSLIRAPSEAGGGGGAMPSPAGTATGGGSVTARASSTGGASSTVGSLRMRPFTPSVTGIGLMSPTLSQAGPSSLRRMVTSRSDVFLSSAAQGNFNIPRSESFNAIPPPAYRQTVQRNSLSLSRRQSNTGDSSGTPSWNTSGPSRSNTLSTNPTSSIPSSKSKPVTINQGPKPLIRNRNSSISGTSPGTSFPPRNIGPGGITLPLNNSVSQLATLSHSAHTLSPYARGHEHIAVRSFPYLGRSNTSLTSSTMGMGIGSNGFNLSRGGNNLINRPGSNEGIIKARRKRIHRLNTTKKNSSEDKSVGEIQNNRNSRENSIETINSSDVDQIDNSIIQGNNNIKRIKNDRPISYISQPESDISEISKNIGLISFNTQFKRPNMKRNPDSRTSYGFPHM